MKKLLTYLTLFIVAAGCDGNESPFVESQNSIETESEAEPSSLGSPVVLNHFLLEGVNYRALPKLKKFNEFEPKQMTLTQVDDWKLKKLSQPITIVKEGLVSDYYELISKKYSQRYCCCPKKDFTFVMDGEDGKQLKFFIDTISESNEVIIYPQNYNFCLKTNIEFLIPFFNQK